MPKMLVIAGKELRVFFKDPSAMGLTFVMPLMFMIVMSLALGRLFGNEEGQPIEVLAVDLDEGPHGAAVLEALAESESFAVRTEYEGERLTAQRARELVRYGTSGIALIFPADFSAALEGPPAADGGAGATVELVVDPAMSLQYVDPVEAAVEGMIRERVFAIVVPAILAKVAAPPGMPGKQPPGTQPPAAPDLSGSLGSRAEVERIYAAGDNVGVMPNAYQQNVPGYTIFGIFWIVALLSGSIVRERLEGTFRRLKAAPLNRWTVLGGKMIPYLGINLLQVTLMLGFSYFAFNMHLGSSMAGIVVVSIAVAATATALGVLVATLVRTDAQAGSLSTLLLLVLSALGGCFVPRFIMPDWLRMAGLFTPQAWALEAYQDLMVRGEGLVGVMPEVGVLLLFATVFFVTGVLRFRLD